MSCKAQAFCQKDVNAGNPEDNRHATASKPMQYDTAARRPTVSSAQLRHQYVQALSSEQIQNLVHRIGAAHAEVSAALLLTLGNPETLLTTSVVG